MVALTAIFHAYRCYWWTVKGYINCQIDTVCEFVCEVRLGLYTNCVDVCKCNANTCHHYFADNSQTLSEWMGEWVGAIVSTVISIQMSANSGEIRAIVSQIK